MRSSSGCISNNVVPFLCIGSRMGLEGEFVVHGERGTDFSFGGVFPFDVELVTIDATDSAVGQVQGELWNRLGAEVIIVFKLMEKFAGCDCIVARAVAFKCRPGFALQ